MQSSHATALPGSSIDHSATIRLLAHLVSGRIRLRITVELTITSWWFQGLVFTGIWVIGHEVRTSAPNQLYAPQLTVSQCGHGAFSSNSTVCNVIGFVRAPATLRDAPILMSVHTDPP